MVDSTQSSKWLYILESQIQVCGMPNYVPGIILYTYLYIYTHSMITPCPEKTASSVPVTANQLPGSKGPRWRVDAPPPCLWSQCTLVGPLVARRAVRWGCCEKKFRGMLFRSLSQTMESLSTRNPRFLGWADRQITTDQWPANHQISSRKRQVQWA